MEIIELFNWLAFAWLLGWVVVVLGRIARGERHGVLFLICLHFLQCGLPLLLDAVVGPPDYTYHVGFIVSQKDPLTSLVFDLYVMWVPVAFWLFGRRGGETGAGQVRAALVISGRWDWVMWALIVLPVLLLLLAPNPFFYLKYAATLELDAGARRWKVAADLSRELEFHQYLSALTVLSAISAVLWIGSRERLRARHFVGIVPWVFLDFWIFGKRSIIMIFLLMLWYILWSNGMLRRERFFLSVIVVSVVMWSVSFVYQSQVRGVGEGVKSFDTYTNARVDFGRDDVIKQTIYAELNPERLNILEYRGQSILFYVTAFVPRSMWSSKPLPYAQYVTSAMFMTKPRMWGWGMTTSWLEEAIANFGWFGFFLGPYMLAWVCVRGDRSRSPVLRLISVVVAVLLMSMHLMGFMLLAVAWMGGVLLEGRVRGQAVRGQRSSAGSTQRLGARASASLGP
jgi:oligosaccharide repeat unit polymerase